MYASMRLCYSFSFYSFPLSFHFSLQAQNYCQFQVYPDNYHTQIHFIAGICIWFVGFIMNIQSDSILRNLRNNDNDSSGSNTSSGNKTKDTQPTSITPAQRYKIPHGGFFQYVSCANFFGEIIEWLGYAIASSSIAAWGFWAFVCANLIPRGMAHHKWYLDKFKEDYPKDRSAVIPFIL
jgi:3-oxo-5-alpha-steroid 4-dehydrogenase 1